MTEEQRKIFRRKIGEAMMTIQNQERMNGTPVTDVLPEIIAALLSLAAYVAAHKANLGREGFLAAARVAAREQWL